MICAPLSASSRSAVSRTEPPDRAAARLAFSMMGGGSANPSGRSTMTSMPRSAAMWTAVAGTASGRGAGMVRPRKDETAAARHAEIVHGLPVGERLAGMADRRLQVDERLVDEARHGGERGLGE